MLLPSVFLVGCCGRLRPDAPAFVAVLSCLAARQKVNNASPALLSAALAAYRPTISLVRQPHQILLMTASGEPPVRHRVPEPVRMEMVKPSIGTATRFSWTGPRSSFTRCSVVLGHRCWLDPFEHVGKEVLNVLAGDRCHRVGMPREARKVYRFRAQIRYESMVVGCRPRAFREISQSGSSVARSL
jgi:hypothetical protein